MRIVSINIFTYAEYFNMVVTANWPRFFSCNHCSINKYLLYSVESTVVGSRSNWKKLSCKIGRISTVWLNIQIENDAIQPIIQIKFFWFNLDPCAQCTQLYKLYQDELKHGHFAKLVVYPNGLFPLSQQKQKHIIFTSWQIN